MVKPTKPLLRPIFLISALIVLILILVSVILYKEFQPQVIFRDDYEVVFASYVEKSDSMEEALISYDELISSTEDDEKRAWLYYSRCSFLDRDPTYSKRYKHRIRDDALRAEEVLHLEETAYILYWSYLDEGDTDKSSYYYDLFVERNIDIDEEAKG